MEGIRWFGRLGKACRAVVRRLLRTCSRPSEHLSSVRTNGGQTEVQRTLVLAGTVLFVVGLGIILSHPGVGPSRPDVPDSTETSPTPRQTVGANGSPANETRGQFGSPTATPTPTPIRLTGLPTPKDEPTPTSTPTPIPTPTETSTSTPTPTPTPTETDDGGIVP